jgi:hypothetical protein
MYRIGILGLTVAGVIALCATTAATATATALAEFTTETGFSGTSGTALLETASGTSVSCKKSAVEATAESKKGGMFHLAEHECSMSGGSVTCTGSGDSSGVVLVSGEWHFLPEAELLLLSIGSAAHFECSTTTFALKGALPVTVTPVETSTSLYALGVGETKGLQELPFYDNESGGTVLSSLLASVNSGEFEQAGLGLAKDELTTLHETEIHVPQNVEFWKIMASTGVTGGLNNCIFTTVLQTCLAEVVNRNTREGVEITEEMYSRFLAGAATGTSYVKPIIPATNGCAVGKMLGAGEICYVEFEYATKPTGTFRGGYNVKVRGITIGGVGGTIFAVTA